MQYCMTETHCWKWEWVKQQFGVILSVLLQDVDIFRPVQPQGHGLPLDPSIPTLPPLIIDPGNDQSSTLADPTLAPAAEPTPFIPIYNPPVTHDPSVVVHPPNPLSSSSSESAEILGKLRQQSPATAPFDSSSEEIVGFLALRPPFNFRYQKHDRKKRQALTEASPSHNPIFLADFPSGISPFRSCPGPARYTTV